MKTASLRWPFAVKAKQFDPFQDLTLSETSTDKKEVPCPRQVLTRKKYSFLLKRKEVLVSLAM